MTRDATALFALLALLALATAAGSFDAVQGPSLGLDGPAERANTALTTVAPQQGPHVDTETPSGQSAPRADGTAGEASGNPATIGDSGVPILVVAILGGTLLVSGALVVLLTGDDRRADPPPEPDSPPPDAPLAGVDPTYGPAEDNPVYRAWRTLRERLDDVDATATPGEVARQARRRGFPAAAVAELTDQFRRVRYGNESPEPRARRAREASARLESGGETDDGATGGTSGSDGDERSVTPPTDRTDAESGGEV